ncbi:MAG TPA: class I SAM-dependent methyltransferase [Opitutaceae bacterium]|nr:class I SAM-dependent methyltransferase [Opitutaceae bacterium]
MADLTAYHAWLDSLPDNQGFRQISPVRPYAHAEEAYDAQYGSEAEHAPEGVGLCELLRQRGVDLAGPALEIGCGTGYLTTGLALSGRLPALLVTDPSLAFLRLTERRLKGREQPPGSVRYAVLNGDDLGRVPAAMFSLIALRSTLHHILDVDTFLGTCARALRPGGVLALSAEPCDEGYVLMGAVAHAIPTTLRAAGVTLTPEWEHQIRNFCATMQFYSRRDVDKTAAEDKHLFRLYELAVMGSRHGLRFDFHPNAAYESFAPGQQPPASGTFENFFPAYLRYCMSFDPALVALIQTHLREQMAYIDACYPTHAGPLFNGVYLFTRSA